MSDFRDRAREWLAVEAPRRGWLPADAVRLAAAGHDVPAQAEELDRSRACQQALCAAGFGAITYPRQHGGQGLGVREQIEFNEEAAAYSLPLSELVVGLGVCAPTLLTLGTPEQKARYLPPLLGADEIWCQLFSEPDAGSDVASMKTRALRDGDDYILSGTKYWITNAGVSDLYIVFAKTDPDAGNRGISCFVVERDFGLEIGKLEDKLGVRGSPTGEVLLDGTRVPVENRIGAEGEGFAIAMNTLNRSRPTIGAQAVGIAQGAIDQAAAYVKSRQQFGRPIAELQGLQFMLADMAMKTEAARGLVYRATALIDEGDPGDELAKIGAMAKCLASDTAMEVTTNGIQLLGGYGYVKEFPMERYFRDAKVTQIYEGTNQVQRVVIARRLLADS